MHETTVKWCSSYLKDRYHMYLEHFQIVVKWFLVYINDLPLVLSECIADIFADDSTISAHNKNIDQVASTL